MSPDQSKAMLLRNVVEGQITGTLQPLPFTCEELQRLLNGCTRYNPGLPPQEESGQGVRSRVTVVLC